MANPDRAGWYDDPDNSEQLRYFDGILWTDNVTPRRTRWDLPTESTALDAVPGGSPTAAPAPTPVTSPYAAAPAPTTHPAGRPTTPDGVPYASYGSRVVAYILDMLLIGLIGMVVGGWFLWKAIEPTWEALDAAVASGDPAAVNAAIGLMDVRSLGFYSVIALLVSLVYQLFFLTRWSATPGKMALGISVRRSQHPGVLDFSAASRRVAFTVLLSALANLPLLGLLALGATVADLLWPLSDQRRQTLHDKVADTVVVVGKQEKATAANTVR